MDTNSTFGVEPERLERLLSAGLEDSDFEDDDVRNASLELLIENCGSRVGQYKLLNICGEGGMGIVYLAEQEKPIRRQVALKIIKPGMDSKRVVSRFEAERQALALLDHPNIAHVYDAGMTETGRSFFVMEHVKGLPITEHCDNYKLTIEQRLRLFQQVCQAIQHAHQRGIIHRDIKPSNILVSMEGDRAVPKIIDFGVAKALVQPLTERTLATEDSRLLGTPEYMSPEQADMATVDIDTRSDIYSLGVLLYVLLTGALPFDSDTLRTGGIERIRQIIRETDPKTPSTRLTKLGEEAKKVAENRGTEIGTLTKHLRKELEWIPLKAIRKERSERYRSASELVDDIDNFLNGALLIAGPLSHIYRLKKFIRRHRALVIGLTAVLVVLIAGVVVSSMFAIRTKQALHREARARTDAQLIVNFLENDVLGWAHNTRIGDPTISDMFDWASERLERKFDERPLVKASIHQKLGEIYGNIGELQKGEQHYLHAIRLYQKYRGDEHPDTLSARNGMCYNVYEEQGRYREMEQIWTENMQIWQQVHGEKWAGMHGVAIAYYYRGKYKEAASLFEEMIQYELEKETPNWLGLLHNNLARVYVAQGRYEEADLLFSKTIEATSWDEKPGSHGRYIAELANLYREQGRYNKAESLLDRTIEVLRQERGDEHFKTLMCMQVLVRLYIDQEQYEEAETLLNEALPITRRRFREHHPLTLRFVNARAELRTKQEEYEDAESLFKEALKGRGRELGDDHPETLETKNDLAILYKEQSDYDEADPLLLEAIEGRRLKLGDTQPHTIESLNNLIELYEAWNKPEKAKEWRVKLEQIEDFEK
jgi:serine/threonine protein kinase